MKYDVAIIGTGPAGLSAALNLKLHNKSIIWFGSKNLSTKVEKSEKIANYPGLSMISGKELNKMFHQQIEETGLEIIEKMVTNVGAGRRGFTILGDDEIYQAKSVLLATGMMAGKAVKGEEALLGKGVSYCATCDGFLYKGKTIVVFCGDPRFEHEVEYLAEMAAKVYVITTYKDSNIHGDSIEIIKGPMKEIIGENHVEAVVLKDDTVIDCDGVFFLRNAVAPTALVRNLEMNETHIVVDRDMKTNKKGIFAAGDCTGRPYQITKAVGEGNIAAHAIIEYLNHLDD